MKPCPERGGPLLALGRRVGNSSSCRPAKGELVLEALIGRSRIIERIKLRRAFARDQIGHRARAARRAGPLSNFNQNNARFLPEDSFVQGGVHVGLNLSLSPDT